MTETDKELIAAYIAQLNPMEKQVLQIAISHLETSFSIAKSIGFLEWRAAAIAKEQAQEPTQHLVSTT